MYFKDNILELFEEALRYRQEEEKRMSEERLRKMEEEIKSMEEIGRIAKE